MEKKIVYRPDGDDFYERGLMVAKNGFDEYEVLYKLSKEHNHELIMVFKTFELARELCDKIYGIYEDGYIDGYNGN